MTVFICDDFQKVMPLGRNMLHVIVHLSQVTPCSLQIVINVSEEPGPSLSALKMVAAGSPNVLVPIYQTERRHFIDSDDLNFVQPNRSTMETAFWQLSTI